MSNLIKKSLTNSTQEGPHGFVVWFNKRILASHNNLRIRHHSEFRTLFWRWRCKISAPLIGLSGNCQVGVFRPFLQRSLVQFRKQLVFLSVIHVWTSNLFTFSLCPCDSKMNMKFEFDFKQNNYAIEFHKNSQVMVLEQKCPFSFIVWTKIF